MLTPEHYVATLTLALLLAALNRRAQAVWCSGVVLANLAACATVALWYGSGANWIANAAIDFMAASLILAECTEAGCLAVVGFYAAMMGAHAWLGYAGNSYDNERIYLLGLSWLAWGQAMVLVVWGGRGIGEVVGRWADPVRRLFARHAHCRTSADEERR